MLNTSLGTVLVISVCAAAQSSQQSPPTTQSIRPGIELRVVDPSGAVVQTAEITIQKEGGYIAHGMTDASGKVSLSGIQPGSYEITTFCPGFERQVSSVTVGERDVASLTVMLQLSHSAFLRGDSPGVPVLVEPITSSVDPEIITGPDIPPLHISGGPIEIIQSPDASAKKPRPTPLKRFFSALGRKLGF